MIFGNRLFTLNLHPYFFFALLAFLGMGGPDAAHSQVSQPYRYERLQKNADDYFHVISLQKEGIALFRERDKYRNNSKVWELILLDTALKEKKSTELEIKERYKLIGYE